MKSFLLVVLAINVTIVDAKILEPSEKGHDQIVAWILNSKEWILTTIMSCIQTRAWIQDKCKNFN